MSLWNIRRGQLQRWLFTLVLLTGVVQPTLADWVGESENTKFMDPATVSQIVQRFQQGQPGLQVGDTLSYIIQFTPTNNGGTVGAGAYVMDYIPPGTEVVGAEFVQSDGMGGYVAVQPDTPAPVLPAFLQMYGDTGIFYSTDPRTAQYINPAVVPVAPYITATNGYALPATVGAIPLTSSHNAWDLAMVTAYSAALRPAIAAQGTCAAPLPQSGGLLLQPIAGPAAGPDTFLKLDSTGAVGPWQRVAYPGSMMGTPTGVVSAQFPTGCVGGTPTAAGWPLSVANPLPAGTNAIRWVAGSLTVGQIFHARIKLRLTQAPSAAGIINNSEVFGGDSSSNAGKLIGKDNMWKYHSPSQAFSNSNLVVVKTLSGMCTGIGCIPQAYSGGTVPAVANLKLRYSVVYVNTNATPQNNVVLSDVLPVGAALVAASAVPPLVGLGNPQTISGPNLGPIQTVGCAPVNAVAQSFCFAPIATMGSGYGGSLTYDVSFAAAPLANSVLSNTANLVSTQLPGGVKSVTPVTASLTANLVASKTTTTTTLAPGGVATYQITITNGGGAPATAVSTTDYLPNLGAAATVALTDRFSYQLNSLTATQTVLGVTSPIIGATATVGLLTSAISPAPYNVSPNLNREPVTFALPLGATIPVGGSVTFTFNALVGSNIAASPTPYTNDINVTYTGGALGATAGGRGYAPVTITTPLTLTKTIDCVYVGLVCQAYANGPIPTASKVRYRLSYANTGATPQSNVVLTDTLPANTSFVLGTAAEVASGGNSVFGIVPPSATVVVPPARQVLTFGAIASLPAGAMGAVTFEVQLATPLTIPSGSYVTNDAKVASTGFPGGSQASLTTSVRDIANVVISKTTSTPNIAPNGVVTYTITATNTGSQPAMALSVYDFLPFTGTLANANTRFNYLATTSITLTPAGGIATPLTVLPTTTVGILNQPPHNANTNQQQVQWNFAAALPTGLAAGASVSIVFTAQPFAAPALTTALLPSNTTLYYNDVQASYQSGAIVGLLNTSLNGAAAVKIPTYLSISKVIECVYSGLICVPYSGSGVIPNILNTKVRYRIAYANTSATIPLTNVVLSDTLPAFTTPVSTMNYVVGSAMTVAGAAITPPTQLGQVLTFANIPSLAPGASGIITLEATLGAALTAGSIVTNSAKISAILNGVAVSETATATASANTVPDLVISKITSTSSLGLGGATATYTITVTNNGTAAATGLKVYDYLPFSGTLSSPTKRFELVAGSSTYTGGLPVPVITVSTPPTVIPYSSNPNQQQIIWDFGVLSSLAAGASTTITFNAAAGSAMPAGNYTNYVSALAGSFTATVSSVPTVTLSNAAKLTLTKTVNAYFDPIHGLTNPYFIPGGVSEYSLLVNNAGGPADANSVFIVDGVPANTVLYVKDIGVVGSGPVAFVDGTPASGLSYTYTALASNTDDIDFSSDGGATWTAVPVPAANGCDATINRIRINPKGVLVGSTVTPYPNFTLRFRVCLQ